MFKNLRTIAIMNDSRFHEIERRMIVLVVIPVNQCSNPRMGLIKGLKTSRIASALSILKIRIKPLQFDTRIINLELPIDNALLLIGTGSPSVNFALKFS